MRTPSATARGRAAVLDALLAQPDPVGIDALAQATARHPNTVREQVNWLVAHGYVTRVRQPHEGRGRPAWLYQARGPRPGDGDYVELAAALAWRLQDASPDTEAEALAAGRRWGADLVARRGVTDAPSPATGRRWTVELLEELGYAPAPDSEDRDVVLHRCPLLQAAYRFPDVVCSVHLGMVQSALEANGASSEGSELRPFSAPGQCFLRLGPGPSSSAQPSAGNASA
ncbi:helix-turn-helix domain-containing protein [Nocardioides sp. STR2]|uniref:Helix-turn-helix domain-containing protein n=1 Tax=Nocardioides pini TaxID=2975053 RepID=A0ABT4CAX2_9ACTN|nr:helix-turn-helix domain-containing protein [Nocardioides pini]MCY4725022.1 helix-turn-helix domain-containing protein [Nocardioides pini]